MTLNINVNEVQRYLGFGRNKPDERTLKLIDECFAAVKDVAEPRHTYKRFDLNITDGACIEAAGLRMHSHSLGKNLRGCKEVIFFAATLGQGPDMLMNRYGRLDITRAAVLQAVGAAAIEDYCNRCQREIEKMLEDEKVYLRPRFSPGYGDLALTIQPDFLRVINADRTVGIVLSEGGVMIPEKSVTAVMGISGENNRCHIEGCELCDRKDCIYRRES